MILVPRAEATDRFLRQQRYAWRDCFSLYLFFLATSPSRFCAPTLLLAATTMARELPTGINRNGKKTKNLEQYIKQKILLKVIIES